jgi:hypothetical protein
LAVSSRAQASYPGANGRITYSTVQVGQGDPPTVTIASRSMRPDGRDRTSLGRFTGVWWSASGRRLAAIGREGLLIANAHGHVVRRIPTPEVTPSGVLTALAPDGRTVVFIQEVAVPGPVDESTPRIWVVRRALRALSWQPLRKTRPRRAT